MKNKMSPLLRIGLLIIVVYNIIDRFIIPIPNWVAMPILIVAIILIIIDAIKAKREK